MASKIFITKKDMEKLEVILDMAIQRNDHQKENLLKLTDDLDRAEVVNEEDIPDDAVTMNSEVFVTDIDTKQSMNFVLVFPEQADFEKNKISIIAPVGSAVLGYRAGDTIEWDVPSGKRRLKLEKVIQHP